jgi:hypothetical protein
VENPFLYTSNEELIREEVYLQFFSNIYAFDRTQAMGISVFAAGIEEIERGNGSSKRAQKEELDNNNRPWTSRNRRSCAKFTRDRLEASGGPIEGCRSSISN